MYYPTTHSKRVIHTRIPRILWRKIKRWLPAQQSAKKRGRGRPRADNRAVLNAIWYVLWTGCQWKAIDRSWFGVSSSVIHERFQTWQRQGIFAKMMQAALRFYQRNRRIKWVWQALDSRSGAAPLGGEATGKNPTDRARKGSKIHLLVDQRGAPLSVWVSAANQADKTMVQALVGAILISRPSQRQHICADRGYDYADVHSYVCDVGYTPHIKHRRRRGEAIVETGGPGEASHPARRWVVERTFNWLLKRRSLRTRWCKKAANWLALLQFACSHILCDMAFFG
jgi:putative transposase